MTTPATKKIFELSDALLSLRPASSWSMTGSSYEQINWMDPVNSCPAQQELEDEVAKLQAAYDAEFYRLQRARAYPSIGDQLDALFHAGVFPPEMAAQIQAVKDLYPKS